MYRKITLIIVFVVYLIPVFAQDSVRKDGYNVFYYENGKVSSEGYMRNGQPDGYWKTYYKNGVLKSEGNRKNFLLDSTWKFYNDSGKLVLVINYKEGMKNGPRITYLKDEYIEENFVNDIKQGWTKKYYNDGKLKFSVFYVDGKEEGIAKEYAEDSTVITLIEYNKGYIINSENINRYRNGLKHGVWKYFYPDGKIKEEVIYNYGKKDGYQKFYDRKGNLIEMKKFRNDVEIYDAPELVNYEIRTDYYKNGRVKTVASYKDDIPEGIRREYAPDGTITKSYIFRAGIIVGEGIVDASGQKQGYWKEFYPDGELMGEGLYENNKRKGEWKFYYRNGELEQVGRYDESGKPDGTWKWFYENGNLKKQESFINGIENGEMIELSDSGKIIVKGNYVNGEEDGLWIYEVNDDKQVGSYINGKKEGIWKGYCDGILYFEGSYIEGLPDGQHIYYWNNGKVREKGRYAAGLKDGEWTYYDYEGNKIVSVTYYDGVEISINGQKIDETIQK